MLMERGEPERGKRVKGPLGDTRLKRVKFECVLLQAIHTKATGKEVLRGSQ